MAEQGEDAHELGPPSHHVDRSGGINPHTAAVAGPAPFLLKTYEMVDDATMDATVSWSPSGASFVVWDPQHFCQHLLPRYFKHSNFSSFIRQLNIYGFRKSDPNRWEFANSAFIRGQIHLLQGIRRRTSVVAGARQQQTSSLSPLSRDHLQEGRALHANVVRQYDAVAQCTTQMQNQLVLASDRPGSDMLTMDTHSTHSAQGLQEEIESLKRQRSLLMMEVMRLRQQLQNTEQNLQTMWQRLQIAEQGQHHMLAFVMQAVNNKNQTVLANIMGQQPHQIRGLSQHQIPWQLFNVSSASAQHASGSSSLEKGRPQLMLPLVGSSTTSECERAGFVSGEGCTKSSPREEADRPAPPNQETFDHGSKCITMSNPGLRLQSHGAEDHPPRSDSAHALSSLDVHHSDQEGLSGFKRPQRQFPSHSTRLVSPSISGPWLQEGPQVPKPLRIHQENQETSGTFVPWRQDGPQTPKPLQIRQESREISDTSGPWCKDRSQAPKPRLIHRENQEMSDTLHYARQEHSFTKDHEFLYQIITKEVSIRSASFLQKKHAEAEGYTQDVDEAEGYAQDIVGGDEAMSASNIQPPEAYGHLDAPGLSAEKRESQAVIKRQTGEHRSAFSLVASAQNEQAQFGALLSEASADVVSGCSAVEAGPSSRRPMWSEESQCDFCAQGLDRLYSIMSDSELGLPRTTTLSGISDIYSLENDSAFWEQLLESAQNFEQPDHETSRDSSFHPTEPSDIAATRSAQDDSHPHQEWS